MNICQNWRMSTSTVLSAMEWQQTSRLPTSSSGDICMPAYKLHKHQRVSSGLSHLIKRVVWARCGRRKSFSRYAAENHWLKRQQTLKKRSLWKSTKGHAMISTRQCFMKIIFGIGGQMAWDEVGRDSPSTTQKPWGMRVDARGLRTCNVWLDCKQLSNVTKVLVHFDMCAWLRTKSGPEGQLKDDEGALWDVPLHKIYCIIT